MSTGKEPRFEDKDARFQTVYYFRVFDYCDQIDRDRGDAGTTKVQVTEPTALDLQEAFPRRNRLRVLKDAVYRFRMTGKASALFSKIHFESGTLTAQQIDPFGASVAFDDANGRFYFKSQQATEQDARESEAWGKYVRYREEIGRLVGVREEIRAKITDPAAQDPQTTAAQAQIAEIDLIIADLRKLTTAELTQIGGRGATPASGTPATTSGAATTDPAAQCGLGTARRGFQVLGPEGFRTFNQDERLIMAMSSDGKPLISVLRDLSDRILNQRGGEATDLLPLTRERLALSEARRVYDRSASPGSEKELQETLQALIDAFDKDGRRAADERPSAAAIPAAGANPRSVDVAPPPRSR